MKVKKLTALLLAAAMLMTTACGNSEQSASQKEKPKETQGASGTAGSDAAANTDGTGSTNETKAVKDSEVSSQETGTAKEGASAAGSASYVLDWEDMAEIHMVYMSMGPLPSGLEAVEAEINKITEKEINTHVNITMIETGNYDQQIGLMMSSGEQVDLMVTLPFGASSFSTMVVQNQLSDITELLDEYGQGIREKLGNLVEGTTINGKVYGVTGYRNLAGSIYIVMRTDVLKDLGLLEKAENMKSLDEYEEILEAVKTSEKWSQLAGIVSADGAGTVLAILKAYLGVSDFDSFTSYDALGDTNKLVAINPDGSDPTVINNFASEDYKAMVERVNQWYTKGYIYKDAATGKEMGQNLIKANAAFSFFCVSELNVKSSKTAACGMDMTCVRLLDLPLSTDACTKFTWTVPTTAKEPEAAMTFLSMMFQDPRISNLFSWGIEGVDYEIVNGEACYIDGNETPAYHTNDFLYGNQFITLPWHDSEENIRQRAEAAMINSVISAYMGFSCDTTAVTNELSAISNVLGEYRPQIDSGVADMEVYEEFLEKLESCGIDKVIALYQEQLDAWLAEK